MVMARRNPCDALALSTFGRLWRRQLVQADRETRPSVWTVLFGVDRRMRSRGIEAGAEDRRVVGRRAGGMEEGCMGASTGTLVCLD